MIPSTSSSAVNWIISRAAKCDDGSMVFTGKTIPTRMFTEITQHVRNLDAAEKVVEPRFLNWVEAGWWFSFEPQHASRTSRARFENGRVQVHFECGKFKDELDWLFA
jgi:hypothetical protein